MRLTVTVSDDKKQKVLEMAKKNFEEKHRGVFIEIEPLPREILEQRVQHGNAPDLIEWDGSDIGSLLDRRIILELNTLLEDGSFDLLDFYPSVLEATKDQGRIGAIPVMAEASGVFYNKALFDQAGIAYPKENWTWDEFVKKARMLNRYDVDGEVIRYGAYLVPRLLPVEPLVWSNGGAFLSEDGTKAAGYLDSSETVEAIRRYLEMYHPLEVTPFEDVGRGTWFSCFVHHKMAMYYDANWTIKPMGEEQRETFGVVMPPRIGEEPLRNIVQVYGYCISAQCQDVQLAWAFLQELASPHTEPGREWAKHNLVVSRTAAEISGQQSDPLYSPFLKSLENARQSAFDVSSMKLWRFWNNDAFQEWIFRESRINVEERLGRIARQYDEMLHT
ncbi:sugar ABC transporter substrate-binding protein [Paenibacillus barcinonensis]|uniref:ABC transporter substrate-binding protein n=1 Tax=Paenibacillus barcinonensis TaxID=198119 RepID=UPI001C10655E|nr:sugar ABC transporter substrate-binding protein [Paenibacillus barcinonensis]MBU5351818.1 sugar ABC transporter substrate-binding protein [Paenibacillus barcinonensis]